MACSESQQGQKPFVSQHDGKKTNDIRSSSKTRRNTTSSGSKKKKSVTFADTASMRLSLHLNEYKRAERVAAFYNELEIDLIKNDVDATAVMINQCKPIDEVRYSARGVHTNDTKQLRRMRRQAAQRAVFMEQMKRGSVESQESIARAYSLVVQESVAQGHRIGIADEKFVKSTLLQHPADDDLSLESEQQQRKSKSVVTMKSPLFKRLHHFATATRTRGKVSSSDVTRATAIAA